MQPMKVLLKTRRLMCVVAVVLVAACGSTASDESAGILTALGSPCVPSVESEASFQGFSLNSVVVDTNHAPCESNICLVNNFFGRVSCPYGQTQEKSLCELPGASGQFVTPPVSPQLVDRPPKDAVFCSCRCDGPEPDAEYCDCPAGFDCVERVRDLGLGAPVLAGSFCLPEGTHLEDPSALAYRSESCDRELGNCEGR